jgi:hypothetical protein
MLLLANCSRNVSSVNIVKDQILASELEAIALAHIKTSHPEWLDEARRKSVVVDEGETWLVGFPPPAEAQGGGPVVRIDKKSRGVLEFNVVQ